LEKHNGLRFLDGLQVMEQQQDTDAGGVIPVRFSLALETFSEHLPPTLTVVGINQQQIFPHMD